MGFYFFLWRCSSTYSTICTASFGQKTKCCTHARAHTKFRFCIWQFFHMFKADIWIEKLSPWIQYSKQRAFCKLTVAMLGCAYGEYFNTDHRQKWLIINHLLPLCHILYLHNDLFLQTHNNLHTAVFYGKDFNRLMKKLLISHNMKNQQTINNKTVLHWLHICHTLCICICQNKF